MELVEEREEDVRMAQLLSIQAGQSSEERQADAREDIGARSIFEGKVGNKGRISVGGKQQSLQALRKIVKKKQNNLAKEKGFGVVVKRKSDSTGDLKSNKCSRDEVVEVTDVTNCKKKRDDEVNGRGEIKPDALNDDNLVKANRNNVQEEEIIHSLKETEKEGHENNKSLTNTNNSLSLLSCDYGSSSSDSE